MAAAFMGLLLVSSFALSVKAADPVPAGDKKVVCYYNNWSYKRVKPYSFSPDKIDPYLCTHIIYAFADIGFRNNLVASLPEMDFNRRGYATVTSLKMKNKHLKVLIGIGGWSGATWGIGRVAGDEGNRRAFAQNAARFVRGCGFDGLALNWYHPTDREGRLPEDRWNYLLLAKTLREEFERETFQEKKPRLLLSISIPHDARFLPAYDIPGFNKFMDFIIVICYDYHSLYGNPVNHNSPLYSLHGDHDTNNINYTIQLFKYLADADKIILGIPTYGRSYKLQYLDGNAVGSYVSVPGDKGPITQEEGWLAYFEICSFVKNEDWTVVQTKPGYAGPYAYKGDQWVCYDDVDMIRTKAVYAKQQGLGGLMFWTMDYDDFLGHCEGTTFPLIRTARDAFFAVEDISFPKNTEEEESPSDINSSSSLDVRFAAAAPSGYSERPTTVTKTTGPVAQPPPPAIPPTVGPLVQPSISVPTSPPPVSSRSSSSTEDDGADANLPKKDVVGALVRLIEESGGITKFWNAIRQQLGSSLDGTEGNTEETPALPPIVISIANSTIFIN